MSDKTVVEGWCRCWPHPERCGGIGLSNWQATDDLKGPAPLGHNQLTQVAILTRADHEAREATLRIVREALRLAAEENKTLRAELAAAKAQGEADRKALRDLRDHFMRRYLRTKKEGRWFDLPPQVVAANEILGDAMTNDAAMQKESDDGR